MGDNILPFVIFTPLYLMFLFCIAQDVAYGYIPKAKYRYWFKTLAVVWPFGGIPFSILMDFVGTPQETFFIILRFVLPFIGILPAIAAGLFIKHRNSQEAA
ncbi:hypothetical protein V0M98_34270 (plasmid) [Pseudomonas silesiensis]|uniref:hypothetical protein n=1 Tax=Pseudomonas silesiensis TaxID=1853130 RepID=UPI0030D4E27B